MPPRVDYSVDFIDGVWKVGLNGTHFGPYSTLDAAVAAASGAAHKAEAQGYEAFVVINTAPAEAPAPEPEVQAPQIQAPEIQAAQIQAPQIQTPQADRDAA